MQHSMRRRAPYRAAGWVYTILVDIPSIETRHDKESYTTIPLGIILTDDEIVTVCTEDTPVLQVFFK